MKIILFWLKKLKIELFVIASYLLIAVAFTLPIVLNPSGVVWGHSGDNFGAIWTQWWFRYAQINHLEKNFSSLVNYPFGIKIELNASLEPVWTVPLGLLAKFFGEVAAFNLVIFLSFPLAGFFMFLLLKYVTKNSLASFIGGLIYMLLPYHFWQSYQHLALAQTQWLPLFVLALLKFDEKANWKTSVFLGLSFSLVALSSVYHAYFITLFLLGFIILKIVYQLIIFKKNYLSLRRISFGLLVALIVFLTVLPVVYGVTKGASEGRSFGGFETSHRPLGDLLSLSSRPWDYIIPPADQPVFGKYEKPLYEKIKSLSDDFKTISAYIPERVVYIGIPSLVLALLGLVVFLRKKQKRELGIILGLCIGLLFLTSLPPFIYFKTKIYYFPTNWLYKFFPFVRVYARMGIVIDLLIIILTTVGLAFLFQKAKNTYVKGLLFLLLFGGFIFEFLNFPPYHVTNIAKTPETYKWLASQPPGTAFIEYPKTYSVADSLFFQTIHQKPFLNLAEKFTSNYEPLWALIESPLDKDAASVLAALGIDYALIHVKDPYNRSNPFDETSISQVVEVANWVALKGNGITGFQRGEVFSDGFFIKVVADPASLILFDTDGQKRFPIGDWRWKNLTNRLYLINLANKPKKVKISIPANPTITSVTISNAPVKTEQTTIEIGINKDNRVKWLEFTKTDANREINLGNIKVEEVN